MMKSNGKSVLMRFDFQKIASHTKIQPCYGVLLWTACPDFVAKTHGLNREHHMYQSQLALLILIQLGSRVHQFSNPAQ